jgi:hypothetical protein
MNILAPKIWAFQMGPKEQNCYYLDNGSKDFDYTLSVYGDNFRKYNCIYGIFRKIPVSLRGPELLLVKVREMSLYLSFISEV